MKKWLLALLVAAAILASYLFELHHYLQLNALKSSFDSLLNYVETDPVTSVAIFFVIYVVVTALSLPGAVILTLASGALFGLVMGTIIASFASTIGATLAFLTSRYILKDSIQNRFAQNLAALNSGIVKDGAYYLFTLRLVPIFPFFLINLAMGLTPIRVTTFYWVSQVGMLAGTAVYVNAGTQLAQLDSLSGILSLPLLISFVLIGFLPLIAKKLVQKIQNKRIYEKFKKPQHFDRNLVVIGAGAGGLVSSYIAAAVKAKVTLVESELMGGDCLNYGCVPSKALIKSARMAHDLKQANKYGLDNTTPPEFSFKNVMARVNSIIKEIEPHDSVERYTSLGVDVEQGYAKIIDPWTVEITDSKQNVKALTTQSIIVATGAKPLVPDLPGIDTSGYLTSETLWQKFSERDDLPKKLVILGGGPIGCELAQAMSRLGNLVAGSQVHLIDRGNRLLKKEDKDVSDFALSALEDSGVIVHFEHQAVRFEQRDDKKLLVTQKNGELVETEYDELILALGRQARLSGFGLEELGINDVGKTLPTDAYLQTQYPNIFAVGDVTGPYQFTHVAAHQAWYASVNALFGKFKKFKADYRVIPWTTFIDPEVARVGLNESEASAKGIEYEVTRFDLKELDRAITDSNNQGFIKVITPKDKDKILGVTIVADHGGELLAEFVLAMKHGLGLNKILGTIHSYPTWVEANKYAAGEWKRAHAPEKLLSWVEKYHKWMRG